MADDFLFVKVRSKRKKLKDLSEQEIRAIRENRIRTDFVLRNTFRYLLYDGYCFDLMDAKYEKEKHAMDSMRGTVDHFRLLVARDMKMCCTEIKLITEDRIDTILHLTFNEIVGDVITWPRIMQFFVFVGELSVACFARNLPQSAVQVIFDSFRTLVRENLRKWIHNHGGWEFIINFPEQEKLLSATNQEQESKQSWVGNLYQGTFWIVDTLVYAANSIRPSSFS